MNREPDPVLKNIRLLYLGCDEVFLKTLTVEMKSALHDLEWVLEHSDSYDEVVERFHESRYDICLVDEKAGVKDGLKLVNSLTERGINLPIIFFTDNPHSQTFDRLRSLGASDCLPKKGLNWEVFSRSVLYGVQIYRERIRRRQAEDELHTASSQNEQLLASITSILVGIRENGCINHWNAVAEKTFGLHAEEVLGRDLNECPITWEAYRIFESVEQCRREGKAVRLDDLSYVCSDGKRGFLGFTVNPVKAANGEVSGFLLFGADITKRREDEDALRLRTEELRVANIRIEHEKVRLEALLSSIGDGMIAVDQSGLIIMMNPRAAEMLGGAPEAFMGKRFSEMIRSEDEKERSIPAKDEPLEKSLASRKKVMMIAHYVRRDGIKFPAAITVAPVVANGQLAGAIKIFRDITREKEIDRMKTEFISTVSHELRTPLTSVREAIAQTLEEILGPINEQQKEFLGLSISELDRLTTIINDLLDISKIEAGKVELKKTWFDMKDMIERVMANYQTMMKSKGLSFKAVIPEDEALIYGDYDRLTQVLTNLVSNAYKFTEPEGTVSIELTPGEGDLRIAVRDSGVGIQKDNLEKIFDRFIQVGRTDGPGMKGTGLGLAISRNLVELHGGKIWVESEYGKGTCFFFSIPKAEPSWGEQDKKEARGSGKYKKAG